MIYFGPSGNSQSFYDEGFKNSYEMPQWLSKMGLNAYEYSCSKGTNIRQATAEKIGEACKQNDIFLSIHAPYYISMSSNEKEKRDNSIKYILNTLEVAKWMDAKRIVIHTGSCSKIDRNKALITALGVLKQAIEEADQAGYGDIAICPEVLGKINQLGTLDEVLEMCRLDDRLIPTVDFAHIHARSLGGLKTIDDFYMVIDKIENTLGYERLKNIHIHFSRVEYSKGGEKRHRIFDEVEFGPEFSLLAEVMVKKEMKPVIICESKENMAEDAMKMKKIYEEMKNEKNINN